MNSASVDLIYLDPPFNSKANYAAPIGSKAAGAEFKDTWGLDDVNLAWHGEIKHDYPGLYSLLTTTRQIHGASMMSYLIYMAIRLMEMRRLLKPTGSIYLHCDPTASHYLKLLLDAIFGQRCFRRECTWDIAVLSGFKTTAKNWIRGHDILLYYTVSDDFTFNKPSQAHRPEYIRRFNKTDEDGRKYFDGRGKRRYLDDVLEKGKAVGDVWSDIMSFQQIPTSKEKTGYPTQEALSPT